MVLNLLMYVMSFTYTCCALMQTEYANATSNKQQQNN